MELWAIYYLMNICIAIKLVSAILGIVFLVCLVIDGYTNEKFDKQLIATVAIFAVVFIATPNPDSVKYAFIDDLYEVVEEE